MFIGMKYLYLILSALCLSAFTACNKLDDRASTDRTNIEKLLLSYKIYDRDNYTPDGSGTTPKFYDYIDGSFRYIPNDDRTGRTGDSIARGDSVSLYFQAYTFSNLRTYISSPTSVLPYYTNRAYIIKNIKNNTTLMWSTDPLNIKVGNGTMLAAVERCMINCMAGDSVLVVLPTNKAYGAKPEGLIDQYAPVAFILSIEKITKQ